MPYFINDPGLFFLFSIGTAIGGYLVTLNISGSMNAFLSTVVKIAFYCVMILSGIATASTIGDVASNLTVIIQTLIFVFGSVLGLGSAICLTKGWR